MTIGMQEWGQGYYKLPDLYVEDVKLKSQLA